MSASHLVYRTLRPIAKRISPLIARWEDQIFADYHDLPPAHPPVFIVGAPRTGSTLLNQLITQVYDVAYISNLADIFYRNLAFGMYLHHRLYGKQGHHTQTSRFGNTRHLSLSAPSEGGDFWYQWLPKAKHFIDFDEVAPEAITEIQSIIFGTTNYFNKPLVFKNLNMGQRMRLIYKITSDAKFIWIKRDPLYTVQSILMARRKLRIPNDQLWSVKPADTSGVGILGEIAMVVRQVYELEKQIATDKSLFPSQNILEIYYRNFCEDTEAELRKIGYFLGDLVVRRSSTRIISPTDQNDCRIAPADFKQIQIEMRKYNWQTYA